MQSDSAIKSAKNDKLSREIFSEYLAEAIIKYDLEDSFVMAMDGKWGSGKTSVLNIVEEKIEYKTKENEYNKVLIFKFNPWIIGDKNSLIYLFLKQLTLRLKKEKHGNLEELVSKLDVYANYFKKYEENIELLLSAFSKIPSSRIQIITKFFKRVMRRGKNSLDEYEKIMKPKSSEEIDLDTIKCEIIDTLKKEVKIDRILIIIDDIDRLTNEEIKIIFQLVKSVADFPKVMYLLAYDRDIVSKATSDLGEEYLEKIIQLTFPIPATSEFEVEKIFMDGLNEVLEKNKLDDVITNPEWDKLYNDGLKYFLSDIRKIKRYINTFEFKYKIVEDDVNIVDFLVLTAIQIFVPKMYDIIYFERYSLVYNNNLRHKQYSQKLKEMLSVINKTIDIHEYKYTTVLVEYLFPILRQTNVSRDLEKLIKDKKICMDQYFENYFRLSVPSNRVSNIELEKVNFCAATAKSLKEYLEQYPDEKIENLISSLKINVEKIEAKNIKTVIEVLVDLSDSLVSRNNNRYMMSILSKNLSLIEELRLSSDNYDDDIFMNAVSSTNLGLSILVEKIDNLEKMISPYLSIQGKRAKKLKEFKELKELKDIAKEKIKYYYQNNKMLEYPLLYDLMIRWPKLEDEYYKKFIRDIKDNPETKYKFLKNLKENSNDLGKLAMKKFLEEIELDDNIEEYISTICYEQ